MAKLLYDIFVWLYPFIIRIISPFNLKAKQWIDGRKNIFKEIQAKIDGNANVIWMHCSSLGEFEQGRPVLEKLKAENRTLKILLTFFSPSGYEIRKNYRGADYIFYLPMDSKVNAQSLLNLVKPRLILFIKYEFWYYYITEAKNRNIPLLLISGIFRPGQPFFKWYGMLHKKMLPSFYHFFVQNQTSADLLRSIGYEDNVTISGDTRFDRVIEIAENFSSIPIIEHFIKDSQIIVAGSTWSEDDEELDHFANTNPAIKFIIAPHNIGKERIAECRRLYKNSVLYSELVKGVETSGSNTVIIDNIGMLSQLYKSATIAYVGGGFGEDGVHNVLEAAVYSKPVVFGPEYEKYFEAVELVECGGAFSVNHALELEKKLDALLTNKSSLTQAAEAAENYVYSKQGAANIIMQYIYENRLLTN